MSYSHYFNTKCWSKEARAQAAPCVQNLSNWNPALEEIRQWTEYEPQPLRTLPNTASHLGAGALYVKDESRRFGPELGSFKALGAPYAIYRILAEKVYSCTGIRPSSAELHTNKFHEITEQETVCVATDGNQGRGLAYGAKIFGCRCVVYIHNHVSVGREQKIKELGAIAIRINGEYEDSVERAKEDCRMNGWHFVSSTSWDDFNSNIPRDVMNAYMVVVEEATSMVPSVKDITHVLVCGGVGSIAAAIFLGILTRFREIKRESPNKQVALPRFVIVEPHEADCLLQSARNGDLCQSGGSLHTMMAGLACRTPSPAAWNLLSWLASDFIAVPDTFAVAGMQALAAGCRGDIPVVSGESSAATMGVMLEAGKDRVLRDKLGLQPTSQVLLFNLEGSTDPEIYERIVFLATSSLFDTRHREVDASYTRNNSDTVAVNATQRRSSARVGGRANLASSWAAKKNVSILSVIARLNYIDGILRENANLRTSLSKHNAGSITGAISSPSPNAAAAASVAPDANAQPVAPTEDPSRNPALRSRPWFQSISSSNVPILIGEIADAAFATRCCQVLLIPKLDHKP
ncbi:hypothetical protein O1611_g950 [Lasiodiplodia mahajangana]|uniref:Uncharacterized protein n=1 Tax=Lasiodiplodia mahajangana TaxID=1108764 RepID=A0ACC2JZF8_9PEZI|nr:hypothetical protein O1611_g950 [Lasiodiplodia mahajangana]